MNQATIDFIRVHAEADVRQLALQGTKNPEVNLTFALDQIAGRQKAKSKLPSWAAIDGMTYPPHLSMEQCSSEQTARYKASIAGKGALVVDLTAGFGVDLAFISQSFQQAVHIERQASLCAISSENYKLLGLNHIEVVCADGVDYLHQLDHADLIFLDPPYRMTDLREVAGELEHLTADGLVIIEHEAKQTVEFGTAFEKTDERKWGFCGVSFYRKKETDRTGTEAVE